MEYSTPRPGTKSTMSVIFIDTDGDEVDLATRTKKSSPSPP